MSFAAVVTSLLISNTPLVELPKSCAELEETYRSDRITQFEEQCFEDTDCVARQMSQLREAAMLNDPSFDATLSDDQIVQKYGNDRSKLLIGPTAFEGASLFLDFTATTTFFEPGGTTLAPISVRNDRVTIGSASCSVPLAPYLSEVRKFNLCNGAIDFMNLRTCLDSRSEFRIENLTDDPKEATISLTRVSDDDRAEMVCMGTVVRATDEVYDVACYQPGD